MELFAEADADGTGALNNVEMVSCLHHGVELLGLLPPAVDDVKAVMDQIPGSQYPLQQLVHALHLYLFHRHKAAGLVGTPPPQQPAASLSQGTRGLNSGTGVCLFTKDCPPHQHASAQRWHSTHALKHLGRSCSFSHESSSGVTEENQSDEGTKTATMDPSAPATDFSLEEDEEDQKRFHEEEREREEEERQEARELLRERRKQVAEQVIPSLWPAAPSMQCARAVSSRTQQASKCNNAAQTKCHWASCCLQQGAVHRASNSGQDQPLLA